MFGEGEFAALGGALRALAGEDPAAARDALDLAAVAIGLKPAAIFGLGDEPVSRIAALARAADALCLPRFEANAWVTAEEIAGLPAWFRVGLAAQREATPILVIGHDAPPPAEMDAAEEAALLGYPICCTRAHHRRCNQAHRARARAIAEFTAEEKRRIRLVAAGVEFAPEESRAALLAPLAPLTGIALCADCAAGTDPTWEIERRYAALAARIGLAAFIEPARRVA